MAGAVMSPEEAGQLAHREVFVAWFLNKLLKRLTLDECARCATLGREWRDACRAVKGWKRPVLSRHRLCPFYAQDLEGIVAMSRGALQCLDLTDTPFHGLDNRSSPRDFVVFAGLESFEACLRRSLLIRIAKTVVKPLSLELLIAGTCWFKLQDLVRLLAGAASIKFVEVDVTVSFFELDYYLCVQDNSFSRLKIRRMLISDGHADDGPRLRDLQNYTMPELHGAVGRNDFSFMPREALHISSFDFSNAHGVQGVQLFDALMVGVAASTVSTLKLTDVTFPAAGMVSLCCAMASPHLRTLSIEMHLHTVLSTEMVEQFVEALGASSIETLYFLAYGLPGSVAEAILRASVGHKTLECVTLNFSLMMDAETSTADSVAEALIDVISANAPTLRTLKLVWAVHPDQRGVFGLDLLHHFPFGQVYAALRANQYLDLYLPVADHQDGEACTCFAGERELELAPRVTFHHPADGYDNVDNWNTSELSPQQVSRLY